MTAAPEVDPAKPALLLGLLDDLALEVTGPAATQWVGIAQAFAGPPGGGREPRT